MLARLHTAVLRGAERFNERVRASIFGRTRAWNVVKALGKRAVGLYRRLASSDGGIVLEVEGVRMFLPQKYADWHALDGYEPLTFPRFKTALRPGDVVVDVGAHIGSYALAAARLVGPSGRVHALEPSVENFAILQRNLALNGLTNVDARCAAASSETGRRRFNLADSSDSNGFYSHPLAEIRGSVEVDCVRLDELLDGRRVDVVKIDVEGAELEVLSGLEKTIAANPAIVLFVEFNPCCLKLAGRDPRELLRVLASKGFSMTLLDERAKTARPVDPSSDLPLDDKRFYANLECVRQPR